MWPADTRSPCYLCTTRAASTWDMYRWCNLLNSLGQLSVKGRHGRRPPRSCAHSGFVSAYLGHCGDDVQRLLPPYPQCLKEEEQVHHGPLPIYSHTCVYVQDIS